MSKTQKGIHVGRRDFIKTTAMAVVGSTLMNKSAYGENTLIRSNAERGGRYLIKNNKLLCISESPNEFRDLITAINSMDEIGLEAIQTRVNYQKPQRLMESIQHKDPGILLACLPPSTFSFEDLSQYMGDLEIPILVYSPNSDLIMIDANFVAELRVKGANVKLAASQTEVIDLLITASSPGILEGKKAVVYGRPFDSTSVKAHNLTEDYVYEYTGVEIEHRPVDELASLLGQISMASAAAEVERWKNEAEQVDSVQYAVLLEQCKLYILLRSIVEEEGLSAVSIDCLGFTFSYQPILPVPCLAFARLRDEGITASCEADICGMLSSMAFEQISGKPSYFANVSSVNALTSSTVLRHCVAPLNFLGPDSPQLPYSLHRYHGLATGLVPEVEFPVGIEVTMGAYSKDLKDFVVWPGTICEGIDDVDQLMFPNYPIRKFCANRAEVEVKDVDRFFQNIAGLHYIMVAGNFIKEFAETMSAENVNIVGPLDSNVF